MGPHSYRKNYKQHREAGSEGGGLPREELTNRLSCTKTVNPESICTDSIALTEHIIFRNIHI